MRVESYPGTERRCLLGARGWTWPEWEDGFYPQDMPPEWRLTFYNTQFHCVFLPASEWRGASEEQLRQWAEDTHDQFLFLLEGEPQAPVPEVLQGKALCLPEQDARITWFDGQSEIRRLADAVQHSLEGPSFLLSRDGDLAQLERVRTLLGILGVLA